MSAEPRSEWQTVVVLRHENSGEEYRRDYYSKRDLEHAQQGIKDWEENKDRIMGLDATYIQHWTTHIETRTVTETPWERLGNG